MNSVLYDALTRPTPHGSHPNRSACEQCHALCRVISMLPKGRVRPYTAASAESIPPMGFRNAGCQSIPAPNVTAKNTSESL